MEKPDLEKAKEFIKDKCFSWNSGIFLFDPEILIKEFKKFEPSTLNLSYQALKDSYVDLDFQRLKKIYLVNSRITLLMLQ